MVFTRETINLVKVILVHGKELVLTLLLSFLDNHQPVNFVGVMIVIDRFEKLFAFVSFESKVNR